MATDRNFNDMLNQYLPNELLQEEMVKRDYFWKNLDHDENWLSGDLIVPFRAGQASTVKFGSLTAEADINQSKYIRGVKSGQPELWGSLKFFEKDLMQHDKVSEQNFLKVLPKEIDDFMGYMKMAISLTFTNAEYFAKGLSDGSNVGVITVDRIERFEYGQAVMLEDGNTAAAQYWVGSVNTNTDQVILYTTVALSVAADISAYTLAQAPKFYFVGHDVSGNRFTNLRTSLLSAANGGTSTLYGVTKTLYPHTQAINVSGASITAANLLEKIFDAQTQVRNKGKGMPNKAIMSYKNLGSCLKTIEVSKGSFKQASDPKASLYGWTEIEVMGVKGGLTLVAIQEMDDDVIYIWDNEAAKIFSNGGVKKRQNPGTKQSFFESRNTSGFVYIVDVSFMGDVILLHPSRCGIIHSISY